MIDLSGDPVGQCFTGILRWRPLPHSMRSRKRSKSSCAYKDDREKPLTCRLALACDAFLSPDGRAHALMMMGHSK